jgi:predicted  nucleic acid-binding Zn-ribbon protein
MKEVIDELSKLGKEIETAKSNVSQLEGRKVEIVKRLQEEFNISTIEETEKLLASETKNLKKLEEQITTDFEKLKENFSW